MKNISKNLNKGAGGIGTIYSSSNKLNVSVHINFNIFCPILILLIVAKGKCFYQNRIDIKLRL